MASSNKVEEINLKAIVEQILGGWKIILIYLFVSVILGLAVALLSEDEFTASYTFVPESSNEMNGGRLGSLASLAGININAARSNQDISPFLYSKIVNSTSFRKKILEAPISTKRSGQRVTYKEYYDNLYRPSPMAQLKKYTVGLPMVLIKAIRGKKNENSETTISEDGRFEKLTMNEIGHIQRLANQFSLDFNRKEGFVKITFTMPEPMASAEMVEFVRDELHKVLIEYRIKDAQKELKFTQERYLEKKAEFEEIQMELAVFTDQNQALNTAIAQSKLQRIQSKYDLAFQVYSQLATQLEQSKLQVNKDTPIFTTIENITVPTIKSAPKTPILVVIFAFLGVSLSLAYILMKDPLLDLYQKYKTK